MKAFGTARLGSNMEVRFLPNGDPVGEVSLAFRLGKKDKATGEYMTQWIKATLYGKRAESLSPYMLKGGLHAFHLRDIRVEEYTSKEGEKRVTLRADIDDVELCQKNGRDEAPQSQPRSAERVPDSGNGFNDMGDDIPFFDHLGRTYWRVV